MRKAIVTGIALVLMFFLLPSCAAGVPQEEYDRVSSDLAAAQAQVQSLQSELSAKETELSAKESDLTAAQTQVQSLQSELSAKETELAAAQTQIQSLQNDLTEARAQIASLQGEEEAAATELANIQIAVIAMMVDNNLSHLPNPVTIATNDMSAFPDASLCGIDKISDPNGNTYTFGQDKDGYILYAHDITGDADSTAVVNYLTTRYSKGTYIVDASGTVTQVTTGYE